MTNPEQELFDFLTTEENLRGLIIAKNQFPKVKERLLSDFWDEVYKNMQDGLKEYENWTVHRDPNLNKWNSKIYIKENGQFIYKNGFPSLIFCWERLKLDYPYFSFWYNEDQNEFDKDLTIEYITKLKSEKFHDFQGPENWFLLWKGEEKVNFSNDESLLYITPKLLPQKAQEYSDQLLDFFRENLEHYYHIKENFRK